MLILAVITLLFNLKYSTSSDPTIYCLKSQIPPPNDDCLTQTTCQDINLNGTLRTLSNGTTTCYVCPPRQRYSLNKCICISYHRRYTPLDICVPVVESEIPFRRGGVFCINDSYEVITPQYSSCRCNRSNFVLANVYDTVSALACIPNPCRDPNSHYDGYRCICNNENYSTYNGTCMPCLPYSTYSPLNRGCICQQDPSRPVVLTLHNICLPCDVNSHLDVFRKSCICNDGYYGDGFACYPLRTTT